AVAQAGDLDCPTRRSAGLDAGERERTISLAGKRRSAFRPLIGEGAGAMRAGAEGYCSSWTIGLGHQRIGGRWRIDRKSGRLGSAIGRAGGRERMCVWGGDG